MTRPGVTEKGATGPEGTEPDSAPPPSPPPPLMVAPFRLDTLHVPSASGGASRWPGRHTLPTHRRRHPVRRALLVVLLAVVLAAGAFAGVRLSRPDPPPTLTASLGRLVTVQAQPVSLPWPATGQAAVAVPAVGIDVPSGPEPPVPVASLTKLMTAYVILHDHPLARDESGPSITVSAADVADYQYDTVSDQSNAAVALGEQLTEKQALSGMLVHSADDFADLLARWDTGSIPTFVDKMNVAATALGMAHSHFADPSGFDTGSQSTASEILKLAALDMANPVFASIVRMSSVTLPVAGTISSYTPLIGLLGIIGVKSGFTDAAGGCDVLAVVRTVHGRPTLLMAAVTGQTGASVLVQAGLHGLALVNALATLVKSTPVLTAGTVVANVHEAGRTVAARAASSASVLTWPGVTARRTFRPARHLSAGAGRGARVGTVVVSLGGQKVMVPVRLQGPVPRQTLLQRIF